MMKNKLAWHTPVIRSNEPLAIREAMTGLAASLGLTIKGLRLTGLYIYKYEGVSNTRSLFSQPLYRALCKRRHPATSAGRNNLSSGTGKGLS